MTKAATKSRSKTTTKAKSSNKKSTTTKAKSTTATKVKKTTAKSKAAAKTKTSKTKAPAADKVLNETGNRQVSERRNKSEPVAKERRKTVRRRQIDPTTCERDYNEQEIQFMHAMDEYKQLSGRMFPTCSEILEVVMKLGYRQIADAQVVYDPNAESNNVSDDSEEDEDGDDFEPCV